MKQRVYIDTSVIGGCFDKEFQRSSLDLIDQINSKIRIGVISDITINEIFHAPDLIKEYFIKLKENFIILKSNSEVEKLASLYLEEKIVNTKYRNDCLHIAYATVYGIDMLVSWNFKHIVNYEKIINFNSVNLKNGYKPLQIYSPLEAIKQHE